MKVFTIGHSNRSFDEFVSLLNEFKIRAVADVRRFPSSRKFPWFNQSVLQTLLDEQGIHYEWFETLGGHIHGKVNERSPNTAIRSPGFRNYADYMMTELFRKAIRRLINLGQNQQTAIMCAEKFFWKCHRRLLCDFLVVQSVSVIHIIEHCRSQSHLLTKGAVITEERLVIYPDT